MRLTGEDLAEYKKEQKVRQNIIYQRERFLNYYSIDTICLNLESSNKDELIESFRLTFEAIQWSFRSLKSIINHNSVVFSRFFLTDESYLVNGDLLQIPCLHSPGCNWYGQLSWSLQQLSSRTREPRSLNPLAIFPGPHHFVPGIKKRK